jgi:hypothetical protein
MPVYFIQAADGTGPIKIGWANDPQKRLTTIQRMSPVSLAILGTVEGDRKKEKRIHLHFADLRLYGEWFRPDEELMEFVKNPVELPAIEVKPPVLPEVKQFKSKPSKLERRICSGYMAAGVRRLIPCSKYAVEGSDYCKVCNRRDPKGIPAIYLEYQKRLKIAPRCKGTIKYNGEQCNKPVFSGGDYCWSHRMQ